MCPLLYTNTSTNYNISIAISLEGTADNEKVLETVQKLINRHEALRTSFLHVDESIVQKIQEDIEIEVENIEVNSEEEIKHKVKEFVRPFNLNEAPLFRIGVIKLREEKSILVFDMHHIITDGISMNILISDFMDLYNGKDLPENKVQYKDFVVWKNNFLKSEHIKNQEEYWLNVFKDDIPVLNIPTDFEREQIRDGKGSRVNFIIDEEFTEKLNELASKSGSTLYMVLLSLLNVLLSKYSNQEDIVIGTPVSGRTHTDLNSVVGLFVNTLAIRNYPNGEKSFNEFMKEVKENSIKAFENQDYQFDMLIDKLNIKTDRSRNALFDVMLSVYKADTERFKINEKPVEYYGVNDDISKFDLTLFVEDNDKNLSCSIEYATGLFKEETIIDIKEKLLKLIQIVVEDPTVKISEIELISNADLSKYLDKIATNKDIIQEEFEDDEDDDMDFEVSFKL